jgi:very-long-chain (3R)-3-hydroxyacyl-CoA dehydratase
MSNSIKYYLAAYNLAAFVAWGFFLFNYFLSGYVMNHDNLMLLNIAQGMAVLEIVHVLLKWVSSPVISTIAQVFSRIFILVLINIFIKNEPLPFITNTGILIVSLAWGITELVRYSLYFLQLFGRQPEFLLWMRYSFFVVLYPLGVTGEWFILVTRLVTNGITLSAYTIFLIIAAASYIYYFPVLYKHMWRQRATKLQ